jgi:hypothetical protein
VRSILAVLFLTACATTPPPVTVEACDPNVLTGDELVSEGGTAKP